MHRCIGNICTSSNKKNVETRRLAWASESCLSPVKMNLTLLDMLTNSSTVWIYHQQPFTIVMYRFFPFYFKSFNWVWLKYLSILRKKKKFKICFFSSCYINFVLLITSFFSKTISINKENGGGRFIFVNWDLAKKKRKEFLGCFGQ
jgi:hypothetical protein